jgi:hypothetical protein
MSVTMQTGQSPQVGEGCAAGVLAVGFLSVLAAAVKLRYWPPPLSVDDMTFGGVCCLVPLLAMLGGMAGAIGAVTRRPLRGALVASLVFAGPMLLVTLATLIAADRGAVPRMSVASAIVAVSAALAGALGAIAGRPKRNEPKLPAPSRAAKK